MTLNLSLWASIPINMLASSGFFKPFLFNGKRKAARAWNSKAFQALASLNGRRDVSRVRLEQGFLFSMTLSP